MTSRTIPVFMLKHAPEFFMVILGIKAGMTVTDAFLAMFAVNVSTALLFVLSPQLRKDMVKNAIDIDKTCDRLFR